MNAAWMKNQMAIDSMLENHQVSGRLESIRIGVFSQDEQELRSGVLIAEALGEVLGRLWRHVDAIGPYAGYFIASAQNAASSGGQTLVVHKRWTPPYDFVIAIGSPLPEGMNGICIGASGWKAFIGTTQLSNLPNPVGPATAAVLAGAEVIKHVFRAELGAAKLPLPEKFEWEPWGIDIIEGFEEQTPDFVFSKLHVFGVGAVTHGFMWLLEKWPGLVSGEIILVDHDSYDESNGQRYIGMKADHVNQAKTIAVKERLVASHPNAIIQSHKLDLNTFFSEEQSDCHVELALIGVDSEEHRRHLALKLPKRVINMWTEGERLGAARYGFMDGWACLFCAYPDKRDQQFDETAEIHRETRLEPSRVRELLFSGEGLSAQDAMIINQHFSLPDPTILIGKPLRSVRGTLCATGKIRLQSHDTDTDVPFAFSSFLAGIGGFIEFMHEVCQTNMNPGHWQMNVLKYPNPGCWYPRVSVKDCYLCSDPIVKDIVEEKYS